MIKNKLSRQLLLYWYIINTEYHGPDDLKIEFGYNCLRTIQRDLADLRDSGLLKLKYDKKNNNYVEIDDKEPFFDFSASPRRLAHLNKLSRLVTIILLFEESSEEALNYEDDLSSYNEELSYFYEDLEKYLDYCKYTSAHTLKKLSQLANLKNYLEHIKKSPEISFKTKDGTKLSGEESKELYYDILEYLEGPGAYLPDPPPFPDTTKLFPVKETYYELFPECNERTRQRDFKELREVGFIIEYNRTLKAFTVTNEMPV